MAGGGPWRRGFEDCLGTSRAGAPVIKVSSACSEAPAPSVPPEVRVSMAASGLLHKRGHRKAVGDASLRETLAAACVQATPLQRRLSAALHNDEAILVEALGLVLDQLSGNHLKYYPFKAFPSHSSQAFNCDNKDDFLSQCCLSEAFDDFASSLQVQPHPAASKLTLLGSDNSEEIQVEGVLLTELKPSAQEQIGRARANLRRSLRRVHLPGNEPAKAGKADLESLAERVPCKVQLVQAKSSGPRRQEMRPSCFLQTSGTLYEEKSLMWLSVSDAGLDFEGGANAARIVTNVPFGIASGGKQDPVSGLPEAAETYSRLGRLLRQQRAEWRGLVAFAESFRNHTGLEWSSELRFLNGSRWVDLLQWSGTERRVRR
ncbi:unnamed protein product [Symbiodinium sp. CCMP2592]|nr:unnamed protein product [Symbiodinium sp. CCMP2592]